jgi:2-keto-4-pentenoate hydratase/2-oxohepta-3-ene-1,7-dioic acid hydratase in catechol pathway
MKFVRYRHADHVGLAARRADELVPLEQLTSSAPKETKALLAMGDQIPAWNAKLAAATAISESVEILVPIDNPEKIICVGLNYRDHALETGKQPPTEPVIFSKLPSALIASGTPIRLPSLSNQVDFEAELVVVIGREGRDIPEASAMDYVFGYACGHDVSSRDWQYHHSGGQWLLGKSFDTFAPLGPSITSKDEILDPGNLKIQMRINGDVMQDSSTGELIFSIPYLVHYLSQIFTLKAGDLIFTGTPAGVGVARKPQRFLQTGDRCEVSIEGLDSLVNPVL